MKKKHVVITIISLIILILLSIPTLLLIARLMDLYEVGGEAVSTADILNLDSKQTDDSANKIFTELDGTTAVHMEIKDYNKLEVSSTLAQGQIRVKLTQGDLWTTEVIEETVPSNSDSILIPLDTWDKNIRLAIWVIGDEAKEGSVDIELIK